MQTKKKFITIEDEKMKVLNFNDVLKKASVIGYNKNMIDLIDLIIIKESYSKIKKSFIQLSNPSIEILVIEDEQFQDIYRLIELSINSYNSSKGELYPKLTYLYNFDKIIENALYYREINNNTLALGGFIFTSDDVEFQGTSLFVSNKRVYKVSQTIIDKLKDKFNNYATTI